MSVHLKNAFQSEFVNIPAGTDVTVEGFAPNDELYVTVDETYKVAIKFRMKPEDLDGFDLKNIVHPVTEEEYATLLDVGGACEIVVLGQKVLEVDDDWMHDAVVDDLSFPERLDALYQHVLIEEGGPHYFVIGTVKQFDFDVFMDWDEYYSNGGREWGEE